MSKTTQIYWENMLQNMIHTLCMRGIVVKAEYANKVMTLLAKNISREDAGNPLKHFTDPKHDYFYVAPVTGEPVKDVRLVDKDVMKEFVKNFRNE